MKGGIAFIVCLVIGTFALQSFANDPPHNEASGVYCDSCHGKTLVDGQESPFWNPDLRDVTGYNAICFSCHNSQPYGGPYGSNDGPIVISHDPGGNAIQCTECHNNHDQDQIYLGKNNKSQFFIATASGTGVVEAGDGSNGAAVGQTKIFYDPASWAGNGNSVWDDPVNVAKKTGEPNRGAQLVPDRNSRRRWSVFMILDVVTTDPANPYLVVKGSVVSAPNIGIFFGQVINTTINGATVRFWDRKGPNAYVRNSAPYGICQVCHTQTDHWRFDGTLAGVGVHSGMNSDTDCSGCHDHDQGFKPSCDTCHGFPPVDAGTLVWNPPAGTGSLTAGAHNKHASDLNYGCGACHYDSVGTSSTHNDSSITLGFSLFDGAYQGGVYDGQTGVSYNNTAADSVTTNGSKTCSNLYCHGTLPDGTNWGGGADRTPVWDGAVACGDCHRATAVLPPTSGQHQKHARAFNNGYNYDCGFCHKDPTADGSLHGNNKSEVIFSNDPKVTGGTYNGNDDMLGSYGSCGNLYCHSTVQSSPPGSAPIFRTTPAWNGSMGGCDKCHYTWGSNPGLATGSHAVHFFNDDGQQCYGCHNWEGVDDPCFSCHEDGNFLSLRQIHANYEVNVMLSPKYGGTYSGSLPPGDAYGFCSNVYCHSDGKSVANAAMYPVESSTPNWDGQNPDPQNDGNECNNCHDYPPTKDAHAFHAVRGYTCSNCHANVVDSVTENTIIDKSKHVNGAFDLSPSGQFWHGASSSWVTIDFTYTPQPLSGGFGGACSNNTCHQTWGYKDPKSWLYTTIDSSFSYTETCSPGSTVNATVASSGGTAPYECNFDWGDGNSNTWGPCAVSHDYGVRDTFTISWQARDSQGIPMIDPNPGVEVINVCNAPPVPDFELVQGGGAGADVVLYERSYDPDFDTPNHSGSGAMRVAWGGTTCSGVTQATSAGAADLSSVAPGNPPPLDRRHFFRYSVPATYTLYIAVKDNGGDWVCSSRKQYLVGSSSVTLNSTLSPPSDALCAQLAQGMPTYPSFQFDTTGVNRFENWTADNHLDPLVVGGGILSTATSGTNPVMRHNCTVFNSLDVPGFQISMKTSCGNLGQLYWTTGADGTETEAKSQTFPLISDGTFQVYTVDLSGNSEWIGRDIRTLRLDPTNPPDATPCTIEIDYIQAMSPF